MTDFSQFVRPDTGQSAHSIQLVDAKDFETWLSSQSEARRAHLKAQQFKPKPYAHAILPANGDNPWGVVTCVADVEKLSSWCLAKLPDSLPPGNYRLAERQPGKAIFGWMIAQHRFDRYRDAPDTFEPGARVLLTGEPARIEAAAREAAAAAMVRDLVNTPAADMGPRDLEAVSRDLAGEHGADITVTDGRDLAKHYPMIHAVGRAAGEKHAPRLIELAWGKPGNPVIAIIGKGVCFDSGGLDIKSSSGMRLMKKDMGGAAHAIALARLAIESRLPVRLHLLVPAVENAISEDALRPGDILTSRKGLTVEIGNTDAEGRLVLADAMTRACERDPELLIDFATLTGAARVALGPDLPAMYASGDALAQALIASGEAHDDPVWRMPLWDGYDEMLASDIADCNNASDSSFAGSITAALFLRKFVTGERDWAHFDTFAWNPTARPGRPKGGAALGLRASWHFLRARFAK